MGNKETKPTVLLSDARGRVLVLPPTSSLTRARLLGAVPESWVRPNEVNEAASVGAKLVYSAHDSTLGVSVSAVPFRRVFVAGEDQSGSG